MIDLQTCPKCGAEAKPGNKFCGRCGAVLETGTAITVTDTSLQPVQAGPIPHPAVAKPPISPKARMAIAGLAIVLILAIVAALILFTGAGVFPAGGSNNQSASMGGSSYVVIGTEEPEPATIAQTLVPTTMVSTLTTKPTTIPITETVFCSSDLVQCNNTCVNVKTDSNNCGSCNTRCAIYQSCTNGACLQTCTTGKTSCQDGCFDLMTSAGHCGDCLNACPTGLFCYNGQCMGKGQ